MTESNEKLLKETRRLVKEIQNREFIFPGSLHSDMKDIASLFNETNYILNRLSETIDKMSNDFKVEIGLLSDRIKKIEDKKR